MSAADADLVSMVDEFFRETCTPAVVAAAETDGLDQGLWRAVAELDLPLIGIPESSGGAGGSLLDLAAVLRASGRYAVPLPLMETSLAAWLLAETGLPVPDGAMAVVPDASDLRLEGDRLSGRAERVPWGASVSVVLAVVADPQGATHFVRCDPAGAMVDREDDLAGMPSDSLRFDSVPVEHHEWAGDPEAPFLRGGLMRTTQLSGAITGTFDLTRDYVGEREQFGRPVSRFQSVQAHVVALAQAATEVRLATDRAATAAQDGAASFEIRAAKAIAADWAGRAAAAAHQAHGAIGMTREYPLQLLTRRLHAWRGDLGAVTTLHRQLAEQAICSRAGVADTAWCGSGGGA